MQWSSALPIWTALEGGEGKNLDAGVGVGEAKRLGVGKDPNLSYLRLGS